MNWREIGNVSPELFHDTLKAVGSPLTRLAGDTYDAAKPHTALALAMLHRESSYATAFNRNKPENRNALNIRPPDGIGYESYPTWSDGIRAWRERITDPHYKHGIYAATRTISDLIGVYAPAVDSNDEGGYVKSIEADLARWGVKGAEPMPNELRIILNPGHRNTTGGNEEERQMTPALAQSYFDAFTAAGYEIVNLGDTNGGLDETCRRMAAQIKSAPGQCVLLDLHYEGSPAPGVFCIVPDITGLRTNANVPQDPRDTWENNVQDRELAKAITLNIALQAGLHLRTSGVRIVGIMDESQTGVGGDGFRLATFAYTSPHREKSVRLVVEHGNHTVQPDRAIIMRPDFTDKCAAAAVAAVKAVYGNSTPGPVFATPAPISWEEGDVGVHDLHGTPALAFKIQVKVTAGKVIPQVSESDKTQAGPLRKKNTLLTAIGVYRDEQRRPFVVLRDKTRVPYKSVRPLVPLPPVAA